MCVRDSDGFACRIVGCKVRRYWYRGAMEVSMNIYMRICQFFFTSTFAFVLKGLDVQSTIVAFLSLFTFPSSL